MPIKIILGIVRKKGKWHVLKILDIKRQSVLYLDLEWFFISEEFVYMENNMIQLSYIEIEVKEDFEVLISALIFLHFLLDSDCLRKA